MRRVFSSSLFFSFGTTATDADASRLHAGALERAPQALAGGVVADAANHRRGMAQAGGRGGLVAALVVVGGGGGKKEFFFFFS